MTPAEVDATVKSRLHEAGAALERVLDAVIRHGPQSLEARVARIDCHRVHVAWAEAMLAVREDKLTRGVLEASKRDLAKLEAGMS